MRRNALFWGTILILIGVLSLVDILLPDLNIGNLVFPLILIALGAWVLWGALTGPRSVDAEEVTIPLEGAEEARVRMHHGAGRLRVCAGAGQEDLVAGTFGGGLKHQATREGDTLDADLRVPHAGFPHFGLFSWMWGPRHMPNWSVELNGGIPLSLEVKTGASEVRLDLTEMQVTELRVDTGASATEITMPASAGHTKADVRSGAASVRIRVPSGVAARIRIQSGVAGVTVDRNRFPREGGAYQSPDYDTAANRADIYIEAGVGAIDVR
jgi:hypothetical protein